MQDESRLTEFTEKFPSEQSCIDFLEKSRWPDGVRSPLTGGDAYRIATRPGLFKCKETGQNFSVRNGTIFEDSRLPLRKWFEAIFLLHSTQERISSVHLAERLDVTPKSAWSVLRRIRYATKHLGPGLLWDGV